MVETIPDPAASAQTNLNTPVPVDDDALTSNAAGKADEQAPTETVASAQSPTASMLRSLTDRTLDFLSTASNETLGACLVGLGASTYLVLGRVGLVIIGVAGGVVLHAAWADVRGDDRDEATKKAEQERRHEVGVDVAKRLLEWRSETTSVNGIAGDAKVFASQQLDYAARFGPEATTALNTFTEAVMKDYVHYWYDYTLPGELSFPKTCRQTFMAFVLSLSGRLQYQRPADAFMTFLTNASSMVLVFLHELSTALNASPNSLPEEAVAIYLKLKPDCSLSFMLDQNSQKQKLSQYSETILKEYLDPDSYNCPPVHTFLKEILAQLILGYTVDMCSKPEWINDWIVYGLEESETTKEVMDIVDAGVEGRIDKHVSTTSRPSDEHQPPQARSKKEVQANSAAAPRQEHKRTISRAEEAMDEAMREARRLTEMMIEEDRQRANEHEKKRSASTLLEDSSDGATPGVPTPSSSRGSQERNNEEFGTTSKGSPTSADEKPITPGTQFTSFDQLVPAAQPTALTESPAKASVQSQAAVLTLHKAVVSIFDDSVPGEKASLKAKPTTDYNILIEPASTAFGGWMVIRKYADFETLHEVLRRISVITGASFNEAHAELPKWKLHTKASLRSELERYLCDAMMFQSLAESEGMKRFLEKEKGMSKSPSGGKSFGWPTPDAFGKIGGDMLNVLTKAPKQVAGGVTGSGKAVFGGVAGLVGSGKRANGSPTTLTRTTTDASIDTAQPPENAARQSDSDGQSFVTDPMTGSIYGTVSSARDSQESLRSSSRAVLEQRRGSTISTSSDGKVRSSVPSSRPISVISQRNLATHSEGPLDGYATVPGSSKLSFEETMNLPPPPSEMPADWATPASPSRKPTETSQIDSVNDGVSSSGRQEEQPPVKPPRPQSTAKPQSESKEPINERETAMAVELMFAVINELYTMSGAWGIRKTFLNAAKTYLLRPGNPQLTSIRDLLQTSLLDSNLNDTGLAHHIYKLRENTLPTSEEMEAWKRDYPEKTDEQKEELRAKARKLLVTKGMPQALTSVMGAAASGEALGKVFDCLQVPEISRALIYGLMIQALKVVIQ